MISERTLDGPHGDLRVRIHTTDGRARAGLVWAHGGSFMGGSLDMPESEQVARELSARGVTVVAVDYQLAPITDVFSARREQPVRPGVHAPVPQDEVRSALAFARGSELDAGPLGWALGGASAGASITASATIGLVRAGEPPAGLVLAYPTVHADLPEPSAELRRSMTGVAEAKRFRPDAVRAMNENHLCHPVADGVGVGDAFAGGADLRGFPPTCIVDSERDDLRASGEAFARELRAADVPVESVVEPGTLHGYLNIEGGAEAIRSIDRIADWLVRRR